MGGLGSNPQLQRFPLVEGVLQPVVEPPGPPGPSPRWSPSANTRRWTWPSPGSGGWDRWPPPGAGPGGRSISSRTGRGYARGVRTPWADPPDTVFRSFASPGGTRRGGWLATGRVGTTGDAGRPGWGAGSPPGRRQPPGPPAGRRRWILGGWRKSSPGRRSLSTLIHLRAENERPGRAWLQWEGGPRGFPTRWC